MHVRALGGRVAAPRHRGLRVVGAPFGDRPARLVDDPAQRMVVQVAPHTAQVVADVHPGLPQLVGRSDAGQLKQPGRVDGAGADDHLATGVCGDRLTAPPELHARTPSALDEQAVRPRVGRDRQIRPLRADRVQIGGRGALPLAVRDAQVVPPGALLVGAVEVVRRRVSGGRGGIDEDLGERVAVLRLRRTHRAAVAAERRVHSGHGLQPPEVRQERVETPSRAPGCRPAVVVVAVSAQEHHRVDGTRPAQRPPPRPRLRHAAGTGLRHGGVGVVDLRPPQPGPGGWHGQLRLGVRRPGFQEQHRSLRVLGQPRREHAVRRTGTDDDVVVLLVAEFLGQKSAPHLPV